MVKILITGANGYIGSYMTGRLAEDFPIEYIFATNRQSLDLSKRESVEKFFDQNGSFDCTIHCTSKGGRRLVPDGPDVLYDNIYAFENLISMQNRIGKLIIFGSGAEAFYLKENHYYALSKKIIADGVKNIQNAYNLRVFSCFGGDEEPQRFIRKSIMKAIYGNDIEIVQNRLMGFIHIEDLYKVVKYYVNTENSLLPKDLNVNYQPYALSEIAIKIINLLHSKSRIVIERGGIDSSYYGDNTQMYSLPIDFTGFEMTLETEINKLKAFK